MANSLDFRVKNGLVVATTATIQSTTSSTSTSTGALIVAGGAGIAGSLYVGGTINGNLGGGSTGTLVYQSATGTTAFLAIGTNGYVLQSNGSIPVWSPLSGISAGQATTATNLASGGPGQIPYQSGPGSTLFIATGTAGTILVSNGTSAPTFNNTLTLTSSLASTSTTTGALQVYGGVGVGGQITSPQIATLSITTYPVGSNANLLIDPDGIGDLIVSTATQVLIYDTATSTSTTTGAVVVSGGVGIGGNLYVGGITNSQGVQTTNIVASGTLGVTGTSVLAGVQASNIVASGTLGVTGTSKLGVLNATSGTFSGTLGVTGTSVLAGVQASNIVASGTLGVTGTSILAGVQASNIVASGTLGVTGTSILAGVQASNIVASGTLGVTGTSILAGVQASNIVASGTLGVTGTSIFSGIVTINNATASTSTNTGALQVVNGGVGIGGSIYVGNNSTFTGIVNVNNTTAATSTNTGALQVQGGVGIGGTLYIGNLRPDATTSATSWGVYYNPVTKELTTATASAGSGGTVASGTGTTSTFVINNATSATSTNSGALQVVNGGAGIGGNLYVGGSLYVNGSQVTPITSTVQETIATAGQTTFTITAGYQPGYVQVFANGILLGSVDYTASNGTTVVLVEPRTAGDVMRFISAALYNIASTSATNIIGGAPGQIPYQTAPNVTSFISSGTTGTVLVANYGGAPTWQNTLTLSSTSSSISTTTGALQVVGGVGIGGGLYVGGTVTATILRTPATEIALGNGVTGGALYSVAIGNSVNTNFGYSIGIGYQAGSSGIGQGAIAIGSFAGVGASIPANAVVISGQNSNLPVYNAGFYVAPVRADATTSATTWGVYYNPVTKELTTATAGSGGGGTVASGTGTTTTFVIQNSTLSTSTNTGALQVWGGAGFGGGIYVGNNSTFTGVVIHNNSTSATSTITGALQVVNGGIGVGGSVIAGDGTAAATSFGFSETGLGIYKYAGSTLGVATGGTARAQFNSTGLSLLAGGYILVGAGSASNASITFVNDSDTGLYNPSANTLGITAGGTQSALFQAGGTATTSTNSGALQVLGGVGIGGSVYLGNGLYSNSTTFNIGVTPDVTLTGGKNIIITSGDAPASVSDAGNITLKGGAGATSSNGGSISLTGGNSNSGAGGSVTLTAGSVSGNGGGVISVSAGNNVVGGSITLQAGTGGTGGNVLVNRTTAATSTATGALVVYGGLGVGGTLYVGSLRADATTSATTWGVYYNPVTKELTTATAGSVTSNTGTTTTFVIQNSTLSTSTNTGALQVWGGAGFGGGIYVGNNSTFTGQTFISNATQSTSTTTGALQVVGGAGIGGNLYVSGIGTDSNPSTISVSGPPGGSGGDAQLTLGQTPGGNDLRLLMAGYDARSDGLVANDGYLISTQRLNLTAKGNGSTLNTQIILGGSGASNYADIVLLTGQTSTSPTERLRVDGTTGWVKVTTNIATTSTTTGALVVTGGVGIGGTLYVGSLRADATTSATTWGVYYNPVTKELTTATAAVGSGSTGTVASGTGTTSTFVINNSTAATSTSSGALQVVNGGAGIGGNLYVGGNVNFNGQIYQNGIPFTSSSFQPYQVNDISSQFNGRTAVFLLRQEQDGINSIVDSKDLEVSINGQRLAPYVDEYRWPWITPYDSYKGFKVVNTGSTTATSLIIFNAPSTGDTAIVNVHGSSSTRQKRRYPYSATSIALGD